jgi:hypothetical protein
MNAHSTLSPGQTILAFVITFALSLMPLLFAEYPPLHDYPFHLARVDILSRWHRVDALQDWYELRTFFKPNISMDVVVPLLGKVLSVHNAGRMFVGMTVGLTLGGCVILHRVLYGSFAPWPFISAFFVFNWILLFGFMNYLFGIGLMFWALAAWVVLSRSSIPVRIVCGSLCALVLYFCHMVALGLYAVFVAGYELQRCAVTFHKDRRGALIDLAAGAVPFIGPLALYFTSRTMAEGGSFTYPDDWLFRKAANFRALFFGDWVLDGTLIVAALIALAVVWRHVKIRIDRRVYLPLGFMAVVYLALPTGVLTAWYVDTRVTIVVCFLVIAVTQVEVTNAILRRRLVMGLLVLLCLRSAFISYQWYRYDEVTKELTSTLSLVPSQSIVFAASAAPHPQLDDRDLSYWQPPLKHAVSLASVEHAVFVPATYADQVMQPLTVTPNYRDLYDFQGRNPILVESAEELRALEDDIRALVRDSDLPSVPLYLLLLYPRQLGLTPTDVPRSVSFGSRFVLLLIDPLD